MFHMVVDDAVDTYVSCLFIGRKTTKVFDYIQLHASAKSAAVGSVPRCSTHLNPPPPTPTPSVPPPAAFPAIPETEEDLDYDYAVELDFEVTDAAPTAPPDPKPTSQATKISKDSILLFSTNPATPPPDVRLCETPNGSDSLQDITSNKIYHLFSNRRF